MQPRARRGVTRMMIICGRGGGPLQGFGRLVTAASAAEKSHCPLDPAQRAGLHCEARLRALRGCQFGRFGLRRRRRSNAIPPANSVIPPAMPAAFHTFTLAASAG
jgi:hypothetical protein